jgi:acetyl esterase/lipase
MKRTRHRYGGHRCQVGDLWLPDGNSEAKLPVVMLIHGGYWRSIYTKALMIGIARAVVQRGWAAWNVEYRRIGLAGGGGGWPATYCDISAAVDHVAKLPGVDPQCLITCGHSVGGCLALWAAAEKRPTSKVTGETNSVHEPLVRIRPRAAMSLAGVTDLARAETLKLGNGAVARFVGGSPEERPEPYAEGSPFALLPIGVPQVLIHGLDDQVVPPQMSSDYQKAAGLAGDDARYVPVEGVGHRDLIDPRSGGWPVISRELQRLSSS